MNTNLTPDELFYIAPAQEIFEDLKEQYIKLRIELDPEFHHEKTEFAKSLKNEGSSFMYFWQKLDIINQRILLSRLKPETIEEIKARMDEYFLN